MINAIHHSTVQELIQDIYYAVENTFSDLTELPTQNQLEDMIQMIYQQNKAYDSNWVKAILFSVIKDKFEQFSIDHHIEHHVHELLYEQLVNTMEINKIPRAYKLIIESMARFHDMIKPLYIGRASEAKQHAKDRSQKTHDYVQAWIHASTNPVFGCVKEYQIFLDKLNHGLILTPQSIIDFREKIQTKFNSPEANPLAYETTALYKKWIRSGIRHVKSSIGSLVDNDIHSQAPIISKEQREQIILLHQLIAQPESYTTGQLKSAQSSLMKLHYKQLERESRQVPAVLNDYVHGRKTTEETIYALALAMQHPFSKVYQNETLSSSEKILHLSSTIAKKSAKTLGKVVEFSIYAAGNLAKTSIRRPTEAVIKTSLIGFNACEALQLCVLAEMETNPQKKQDLQAQTQKKLSNLSYNSRKALEAIIVSAATGIAITAMVASAGTAVPAIAGAHGLLAAQTLEAIHMTDHAKTGLEFTSFLHEIVMSSSSIEDKDKQEMLVVIREMIDNLYQEKDDINSQISISSRSTAPLTDDETSIDLDSFSEDNESLQQTQIKQLYIQVLQELKNKTNSDSEHETTHDKKDGPNTPSSLL